MNYNELNRFTGSLTYSIRRFIYLFFIPWHKEGGGGHGTMPPPSPHINTTVLPAVVLTALCGCCFGNPTADSTF